jgi:hypothetical protein
MKSKTTIILWIVYICLLGVLLPHTAWAFSQMEPLGWGGLLTAWVAAIAFEASIAVLTHKLAQHMEGVRRRTGWGRFSYMYLNAFALGLLAATLISALANLAHAVEFGKSLLIFAEWGIPQGVYSVAFGGILPVVSLIFARVLSNVADTEETANPELVTANITIRDLRNTIRQNEQAAKVELATAEQRRLDTEQQAREVFAKLEAERIAAEQRAELAEQRFGAAGDLMALLFAENKRDRIIAAKRQWPQLNGSAIAQLTDSKPNYVSEVLSDYAVNFETAEVKQ